MIMRREISAGGLVCNRKTGKFLLILDLKNRWTLPKGHLEKGETVNEAALREVSEETGIPEGKLKIVKKLGVTKYVYGRGKSRTFKMVTFYMMVTDVVSVKAEDAEINGVKWFDRKVVLKKSGYSNTTRILRKALRAV